MSTTQHMQILPDYFSSPSSFPKPNSTQTNPRYRQFRQTHFTAGDDDQFQRFRFVPSTKDSITHPKPATNRVSDIWHKHADVTLDTVDDTFNYIFYKFKKGIFVKIQDNKLSVFLPFSNANYVNEWSDQISDTPDDVLKLVEGISKKEGYKFRSGCINRNKHEWYGNNCLVRNEFPINEGDCNVGNIKNMLEELCNEREVPDIEFFINRRDFPLLTRDGTEAYNNIWGSRTKPLVSHSYDKYIPILGMVTSERYADIPIPTHNDWSRVQVKEGKWFPRGRVDEEICDPCRWEDKIETAVFRGASTGAGVTIGTNMRLMAAAMSENKEVDDDGVLFLNAGITKWNLRPRKLENSSRLQTIDVEDMGLKLVDFMPLKEQTAYKYILHIDGHVSAFRLTSELGSGSLVLKVDSPWKSWFSHLLIPYVHYVPIKSDLSDLVDRIKWCKQNDDKCKEIVKNAIYLHETVLSREGILDNLRDQIVDIASVMRMPLYQTKTKREVMLDREEKDSRELMGGDDVSQSISDETFQAKAVPGDVIFENKLSRVFGCTMNDKNLCMKRTSDVEKRREYVHETYMGLSVGNDLLRTIPNFARMYGMYKDGEYNRIVTERVPGRTLHEYLQGDTFRFDEFRMILMQVCLTLAVAQRKHGLVHNDLTPWNIILRRPDPPGANMEVLYEVSDGCTVKIKSRSIPVIVDLGRSNAGDDHSFMKGNSKILDILTLILTSAKTLVKRRLPKEDFTKLMNLVNYLSGNRYLPNPLKTAAELKAFLAKNSKYAILISSPKFELEDMSPIDFVNLLRKHVYIETV